MKVLDSIAEMLHEEYGFDSSSPGLDRLKRVVGERCQITQNKSEEEYLFLLENSKEERDALLETVIVPETFFFRHRESFEALVEWAKARQRFPIRVLSAACSTGEEAYSIAMAMLDGGFRPEQFTVEACDVSAASLEHARKGLYTSKAFRSEEQAWRERYFTNTPKGWQINSMLRSLVRFRTGNLLELAGAWDAIFCRNVMIYFSLSRQMEVVRLLGGALADDGLLFLGPAEPPVFLANGWKSSGYSMSFSCLKHKEAPAIAPARQRQVTVEAPRKMEIPTPVKAVAPKAPERVEARVEEGEAALEKARRLADAGRLAEAEAALEHILRAEPQNPEAHFLSGLVAETQNRGEAAETHYRKTLYLAPEHAEALRHMALLLRKQGRTQAAENLLRRAGRHTLIS